MFKQKGIWEKLLCEQCEQKLSVWEGYASKALFGGEYTRSPRHGRLMKISGLDYKKLKLFQLSILWRAGVSSHELFSAVKLGPHQEFLRAMLFEGEPGPPNRYGCVMFGIEHNGEALKGVLIPPKSTHIQGHKAFRFIFGGFLWVMLVSGHNTSSLIYECTLQTDGSTIIMIRQASEMKNLVRFSQELARLGRSA